MPSSTRSRRKTMQHPSKEGQSQAKDTFGKDPWTTSNDRHDDAASQSSAAQPSARTEPIILLPRLVSYFEGGRDTQVSLRLCVQVSFN
jgi:hypothetical protein